MLVTVLRANRDRTVHVGEGGPCSPGIPENESVHTVHTVHTVHVIEALISGQSEATSGQMISN